MNTPPRDIRHITSDLKSALEREATTIIDIGKLLLEAKKALDDHGYWLSWLEKNFGKSVRTAQNYMNAARFALKYDTVAHLKLKPKALYYLGNNMDGLPLDEINAVFKAAETSWVDDDDIIAIIRSIHEERDRTPPREIDLEKLKQEDDAYKHKRAEEEAE